MDDGDPAAGTRSQSSSGAAAQAESLAAAVRDDPAERLALACSFYDQRVQGRSIRAYRRAEVAFMRWQLRRGVLAPPHAAQPGSPWWRAVNESLLRDAAEAALLFNGESGVPRTTAVQHWVSFLVHPSPQGWYRAHNASIVAGYLEHRHLADREPLLERFLMDVALLRVFYAHSLLAKPGLALGRMSPLGRFLGDPRRRAADLFLSMQNVLPDEYPIPESEIDVVLAQENYVGRVFDYGVIAPRLEPLYRFAADDLGEPRVAELCTERSPVYAWPFEYRDAWQTSRSRIGIAAVAAVIGRPVSGPV
jgi:hypothetical protein